MAQIENTWPTRELPILVATVRALDAGDAFVELADVGREAGLSPRQLLAGLRALEDADPAYISTQYAAGWSDERWGGGYIDGVSERARRELGAWPSAESLADQLMAALLAAADRAESDDDAERLREAAGDLGSSVVKGVLVSLFTKFVTAGMPE